jgi:hypothetical protein
MVASEAFVWGLGFFEPQDTVEFLVCDIVVTSNDWELDNGVA